MEISLDTLAPGMDAVVTKIFCRDSLSRRLSELGLVPGTRVRCRCRNRNLSALELRGTVLAIRRRDLRCIRGRQI